MNQEGVIKFRLFQIQEDVAITPSPRFFQFWDWLRHHRWLGKDRNGYGYGNLSVRTQQAHLAWPHGFFITGSQTSLLERLTPREVALVTYYSIEENYLYARGQVAASSESLSHAALYRAAPQIRVVVHVHHKKLWQRTMGQLPTTPSDIPYGTPAMARALQRQISPKGIIVMGGHQGGLMVWGQTYQEIKNRLLQICNEHHVC